MASSLTTRALVTLNNAFDIPNVYVHVHVFVSAPKRRNRYQLCLYVTLMPSLFIYTFYAALGVALQVAGVVVMVTLALLGYDLLPDDVGEVFLDVRHNRDFLRGLAWLNKYDGDDVVKVTGMKI